MAIHPVYLVGAGPGDPGLITVRGQAALDEADVVIADRLVPAALLRFYRPVELLMRGERRSALPQDEINRLLVERARAGKRVVRLKGGDPFVFGRGGEEAEALRSAGIPFIVVPGVTAAVAAPAYAGIPLTHRGVAGAVAFVTGHEADDKSGGVVSWEALATGTTTLVVYMSVSHLGDMAARLVASGRPTSTPVAVIERGTMRDQRVIVGTLGDIEEKARAANVAPPALTVVGEVVRLRERLAWEGASRPPRLLYLGKEPRGGEDPGEDDSDTGFADRYVEPGEPARGIEIRWTEPLHARRLRDALGPPLTDVKQGRYRWIAFTSPWAVAAFADAIAYGTCDARALAATKIAALESTTALRLRRRLGIHPDVTAAEGGRSLADAIVAAGAPGRVLFPRALDGRDELPESLRAAGYEVDVVAAYESVPNELALAEAAREHALEPFDAIAFTSPRGAAAFLDVGPSLDGVLVGAIGETTAASLRKRGVTVDVVASRPRHGALIDELAAVLARPGDIK